jgi:hypothetical protein
MKKLVLAGIVVAVFLGAGVFALHTIRAQDSLGAVQVSRHSAETLQHKIDNIKATDEAANPRHPNVQMEISEAELESYVLYSMREDIPVQLDSINVQLTPGTVAANTQVTFNSNSTGNPLFDALVGGTHNLSVRGHLSGSEGMGKFDLEEVKVDGIPVPKVLIQTLVEKYVKPKYPEVDLKAPFELPWGIRSIDIGEGKARIVY